MSLLQHTVAIPVGDTGYDIDHSVKIEDANNEWFYNASPTAGNRRTYTFSFWVKRTEIGLVNASGNQFVIGQGQHGRMYFGGDYFQYRFDDGHDCRNVSRQFRDTSAWYHFVVAVDTNQSSSSNRVKLYVNGESLPVDDHDGGSFPDIQDQGAFFSTSYLTLGTAPFGGSYNSGDGDYEMSGYLSEFCAVDGQQLTPTDFGEFDSDSGIWKPIDVSGINFGSQGFYLNFATAGDLGDDKSGNGNDLTENNLAAADQATDTPTNNFCTYNNNFKTASTIAATEGQTKVTCASGAGWVSIVSTFGLTSGKWYWEAASSGHYVFYGIADVESDKIPQATGGYFLGYGDDNSTKAIGMYGINGQVYSDTAGHNGPGAAANTVVQIALDMDNRCVYFGANGSYISGADPTSGASKTNASQWNANWSDTVYPALSVYAGYHSTTNFGGYTTDVISSAQTDANGYGTFEYAPPSGYYAICTKNLAEYG